MHIQMDKERTDIHSKMSVHIFRLYVISRDECELDSITRW